MQLGLFGMKNSNRLTKVNELGRDSLYVVARNNKEKSDDRVESEKICGVNG